MSILIIAPNRDENIWKKSFIDYDTDINVFNNFTYEQLNQNFIDVHEKEGNINQFDLLNSPIFYLFPF